MRAKGALRSDVDHSIQHFGARSVANMLRFSGIRKYFWLVLRFSTFISQTVGALKKVIEEDERNIIQKHRELPTLHTQPEP